MNRRTFLKTLLATPGTTLVGSAGYAYQSSAIEITKEQLVLPELRETLRIVAISDVHAPPLYVSEKTLVNLINSQSPDIFIMAGDTVATAGDEGLVKVFGRVKARFKKLSMLGNWEYLGQLDLIGLEREYGKAGFSLLVNKAVDISGLVVIGLDDFVRGSPDYHILKEIPKGSNPVLVISHCPKIFDYLTTISPTRVVTISGHTHGGQIAPFGIAFYTPHGSGSYVKGWYHKGNHSMYVMRGIGTSTIPIRIGARPEILVLDLMSSKA